jgi:3-hydroxyacyl-[acyl-carrier-protein] dehydratase
MRWRLLERISEFVPGEYAVAISSTNFPDELFSDHFPSFPVTPGVLLTEMGAQLSGLLVQATVLEQRRLWIYPLLGMIERAKFRVALPPRTEVEIRSRIESMRSGAALCKAQILSGDRLCSDMNLMLAFDPSGSSGAADPTILQKHFREELKHLGTSWSPPGVDLPAL